MPCQCLLLCPSNFSPLLQEVEAARTISQRGVVLVATAHGTDLGSLLHNAELNALVGGLQVRGEGVEGMAVGREGYETRGAL